MASSGEKKKIALIGSGNWGSAIAKIVGKNVMEFDRYDKEVLMWVYEEMIDGKKLTEIINEKHENVKYLPGTVIPSNIIACPDLVTTTKSADVLIIVLPHQFIPRVCGQMKSHIKPGAIAISLIKGLDASTGGIQLVSHQIETILGVEVSVLMGANLAEDVAQDQFVEATVGTLNPASGQLYFEIFNRSNFQISVVNDIASVELCGALKNIVALAAGISDGLGYGASTKAAILRIGLVEMHKFASSYYHGVELSTFMESCGVADLIATCYGGRNRRVAEAFVKTGKSIDVLEAEMLNGQKLQGPHTAHELSTILKKEGKEAEYPLFTAVHKICFEGVPPQDLLKLLAKL